MSSIPVDCIFGAKRDMSAALPKHQILRFCSLKACGAVGMLGDDIAAEIGERLHRRGFLRRIEPRIDHDEPSLDLRVDRLRGKREGVHAQHHLRHLVGAEIADDPDFDMLASDRALDRSALMEARIVGAEVGRCL